MAGSDGVPDSVVGPGDLVADKYLVDYVLGAGGMGVVVAATHRQLGQKVAIKLLLPETLERTELVHRFEREARAAAKLKSDHVARVVDVGVLDTGAPYMVMEHLEGVDLAALVERRGPVAPEAAAEFVSQACEAIEEAHAAGIVHRDLKPSNLFLTSTVTGAARVKVLDFGISKLRSSEGLATDGAMTKSTAVMGSPMYMSPEQMVASKNVDERADIWSLGCVLFELVAGRAPWNGATVFEIASQVMAKDVQDPADLRPDLPEQLAKVILRCMRREQNERYPSARELRAALADFRSAEAAKEWLVSPELERGGGDTCSADTELASLPTETSLPARSAATGRKAETGVQDSEQPPPAAGAATTTAGLGAEVVAPRTTSSWLLMAVGSLALVGATGVAGMWLWADWEDPASGPASKAPSASSMGTPMLADTGSSAAASPAAAAAASAPSETLPLHHPCGDSAPQGAKTSCPQGARSWCDESERLIACCGPGLVPIAGRAGSCGCPPGGVSDGSRAPAQCPRDGRTPGQKRRALNDTLESLGPQVQQCLAKAAGTTTLAKGRIVLTIELTPEGRVFSASLRGAGAADPEEQVCALRVVQTIAFPPPVDGTQTLDVPVVLDSQPGR